MGTEEISILGNWEQNFQNMETNFKMGNMTSNAGTNLNCEQKKIEMEKNSEIVLKKESMDVEIGGKKFLLFQIL